MNSKFSNWDVLSSRDVYVADPWVTVSVQQVRLPNGQVIDDYHQIKLGEFTIIFAQTTEGKIVVERQYKHGVGKVSLTLPAGAINPGEDPLVAAKRELLEETGFRAESWQHLASYTPHGSYGCGQAHLYKASEAYRTADPDSGDLEEMDILLLEPEELLAAIKDGEIALLGTMATVLLATHPLLNGLGINE